MNSSIPKPLVVGARAVGAARVQHTRTLCLRTVAGAHRPRTCLQAAAPDATAARPKSACPAHTRRAKQQRGRQAGGATARAAAAGCAVVTCVLLAAWGAADSGCERAASPLASPAAQPPLKQANPTPAAGIKRALPPGCGGLLVAPAPPSAASAADERSWAAVAAFDRLAYWNHDTAPAASDWQARALDWLALAEQVRGAPRARMLPMPAAHLAVSRAGAACAVGNERGRCGRERQPAVPAWGPRRSRRPSRWQR